jgi:HK97 gp10 family phage protein
LSEALSFEGTVVGDAELRQHFLDIGSSVRERLRRALTTGGLDIAHAAEAEAPHRTGELAGTIRARLIENDVRFIESVGPTGKYGTFVGRLMEFGVVSHGTAENKSAAGGKRQKVRRVRELRAAGQWRIEPMPFMGPAFDSLRGRIEAEIEDALFGVVDAAGG